MYSTSLKARALALAFLLCALSSCNATNILLDRTERAQNVAAPKGWQRNDISTAGFRIAAWERFRGGSDLTIYLEGDGYNWINRYTPSSDPTPVTPIVLELAVQDPSSNGLYLARPCQYLAARDLARCNPDFWLDRRYAPEVVAAIDQSISEGKRRSGAQTVTLVGYSGGGALAVLVAARRNDVRRIVTLAANLDLTSWTNYHDAPLYGSLDPAAVARDVARVPQVHMIGTDDAIVPRLVTDAYMRKLGAPATARVVELKFSHTCCWVRDWPDLLRRYVYN